MKTITVEVWLYGDLARYGKEDAGCGYACVQLSLSPGATLADVLAKLCLDTRERGITFINGKLSALPGIQKDLGHPLEDGDRIAFFHLKSMWPFQYRHGISLSEEMTEELRKRKETLFHHRREDI